MTKSLTPATLIPYGVNYTFFLYFPLYGGKVAVVTDVMKYF